MIAPAQTQTNSFKTLGISFLLIVLMGLLMTFVLRCPCERMPGTVLSGKDASGAVADWSFANNARLCQIQVAGVIPWSVNSTAWLTQRVPFTQLCSLRWKVLVRQSNG